MFSEKLRVISHVDTSGSRTSQRFEYQVACVFLTFLTLYKKTNDFYILLDYIDDFVVVEHYKPGDEIISFVQVKTKEDKPISISTIIKKEWILKQSKNYKNFLDEEVKNVFMTNLGVSFKQKVVSSTELISLEKCNGYDGIDTLKLQICDDDIKNLDNFFLLRASISLASFKEDLKGKMHEYAIDNELATLTAEAIDTVYLKIWEDLTSKQNYIPTDEDQNDIENLINKKGLRYSHIKNIFAIMQEIQFPEEGKISEFCQKNKLYFDSMRYSDFRILFKNFRNEAVKNGMNVIKEAFEYLKENKYILDELMVVPFSFSKRTHEILMENETINTSEFFKKYNICISIYFTYKTFIF